MTYKECAQSLRKMIQHREKMHQEDFYEMTPEGEKLAGALLICCPLYVIGASASSLIVVRRVDNLNISKM